MLHFLEMFALQKKHTNWATCRVLNVPYIGQQKQDIGLSHIFVLHPLDSEQPEARGKELTKPMGRFRGNEPTTGGWFVYWWLSQEKKIFHRNSEGFCFIGSFFANIIGAFTGMSRWVSSGLGPWIWYHFFPNSFHSHHSKKLFASQTKGSSFLVLVGNAFQSFGRPWTNFRERKTWVSSIPHQPFSIINRQSPSLIGPNTLTTHAWKWRLPPALLGPLLAGSW